MPTKIALIGAGSVVFAKNLISDILQFPEFDDIHLSLMDIEKERVELAELMTQKIITKLAVNATVSGHLDRTEAIKDANYVICTIQVGGYKPGTVIDFEIPRKYGLQQTIADTLGVGGVFRTLRTAPEVLKIAQDIEKVGAPDCTFLNYTNPMAMLCMAVDKAVGVPTVGLCHSVQGTSAQLANYAGLDMDHVSYKVAGINHMAFFLEYQYKGQDAYPLFFNLIKDEDFKQDQVRFEMMRRLGYFVTESSEHQSEYTPHFIHHGQEVIDKFNIPIDEYLRRCESGMATWNQTRQDLLGDGKEITVNPQSHEYGSFIIHSMETDTPRVIYGNVPNTGLITNLPDRCCVEVPVLVDKNGLQPTHIGDLPPQLASICRSNVNVQELTVEAVLTGNKEHIYHAVMADPHASATLTLDQIWSMCDELIAEHQKVGLLGEYNNTITNTGRTYQGVGDKAILRVGPTELTDLGTDEIELELIATNPSIQEFNSEVEFQIAGTVDGKKVKVPAGNTSVSIAAGNETHTKITVKVPQGIQSGYSVSPIATNKESVCVEYVQLERQKLKVATTDTSPNGSADWYTQGSEVEIRFMDVNLLKGHIRLSKTEGKEAVGFHWRIADTDVTIHEEHPCQKSCIELFFKGVELDNSIKQFFLMPREEGIVLVDHDYKSVEAAEIKVEVDKGGYNVTGHIPFSAIDTNLSAEKIFFMDLIITACALGDAHGAVKVGWNGQLASSRKSNHYTAVIPS